MTSNSGRFLKVVFIWLCFSPFFAANAEEPLPAELFSQLPQYSQMSLSPDGNKLAFFQSQQNFTHLIVLDLQSKSRQSLVDTDNTKFRLNKLLWVNDDYLVFSTKFASNNRGIESRGSGGRSQQSSRSQSTDESNFLFEETRLLVVRADGSKEPKTIDLAQTQMDRKRNHIAQIQDNILDIFLKEPNYFILGIDVDEEDFQSVYKVNVKNNSKNRIKLADPPVRRWVVDQDGRERVGIAYDDRKATTYCDVHDIEKDTWTEVWEHDAALDPEIVPLGFGLDPYTLYVRAKHQGKYAIFTTDTRDASLPLTLKMADPDRDIMGALIRSSKDGEVVGARYQNGSFDAIYWDDFYRAFQQSIDKALPTTNNHLISFSADQNRYLVYSTSSTVPGVFLLGDRKSKQLAQIAENYSGLNESNLSAPEEVSIPLRDGSMVAGFLTKPKTSIAGPLPAVVLANGRENNSFDNWAAFFSSRGIAVLQLDATTLPGYGDSFRDEGLAGWGIYQASQLEDAANWLLKENIANKDRLCVVGTGYAGQAVLDSTANSPELWRCAISLAGVSDLIAFREGYRDEINYKTIRRQIGDDNNSLAQASASEHVGNIKAVILLAHGENDFTVPVTQSQKLTNALKSAEKTVEYVELKNGSHDLDLQENRTEFFNKMDAFLSKYLL